MPLALTDEDFLKLTAPDTGGGGTVTRNAPPELDARAIELGRLGQREGVPFNQGLPTIADIGLKARKTPEQQMEYLAKSYGPENVRLNELGEPVVNIKGEDYVVNPHKLTMDSLTGLAAYAPETLLSALALRFGGKDAGMFKQALVGAIGAATGAVGKDVATGEPIGKALGEEAANIPVNTAGGVLLGAGVKATQTAVDMMSAVARGGIKNFAEGIPNPLAKTKLFSPANPELTSEGVTAAQNLAKLTGIPARLSPAEATGIPLLAQLEVRQENVASGAGPSIAARKARDDVSRAWQDWMVKPDTLGTDEEVARRGIGVLRASVDPLEQDVALAKFALEAQQRGDTRILNSIRAQGEAAQQAKVIRDFNVGSVPIKGAPLTETGDLLRNRVVGLRDVEQGSLSQRYNAFFEKPETTTPNISGAGLKSEIDQTLKELPGVTKGVDELAYDTYGNPITRTTEQKVPVATPIRSRLEELSGKLADGKISINDLKQIRTDVGDAIKQGEAIPGVKEGRLKQLYSQISGAIDEGLNKIGNPALKAEWEGLTGDYETFANKFSQRTLAPLFKEADQPGVGNTDFAKSIIGSPDKYNALRAFLGTGTSELQALGQTTRHWILENSLADGSSQALNGPALISQLEKLQKGNPQLFADAFGKNGEQFLKAGRVLATFQKNLPADEVEALLNPANRATPNALSNLQQAERRLKDEYTNGALKDFIQGDKGDLKPDDFIRFLPSYKLSDVKEVAKRLATDPDTLEQVQRKTILSLFQEARRNPSPADVLALLKSGMKGGDVLSGTSLVKALGKGDQYEKYKALLSPDQMDFVQSMAKRELLREEKVRVGGGTGIFSKGDVATGVLDALTPGKMSSTSILKDLSTFTRDKVASWILASPKLNALLLTPHTLADMPRLMSAIVSSEPFIRAAITELKDPGDAYKVLSTLKSAFGTGKEDRQPGNHQMSDAEFDAATK